MTSTSTPATYRPAQIWLHWIVVVGVIVQIGFHDAIVAVIDARNAGTTPSASNEVAAMVHVLVGSVIALAVIGRLFLRWQHGVPGHAPGTSPLQARLASAMHLALYALLLAMVVTGILTWVNIAPLGGLHFLINIALFFSALSHAGAAVFNQLVRKDGTLTRMKPRW
jgi:cytochrome b561